MKFIFCGDFVSQDPKSIQVDLRLQNLFKDADYVAVNFEAPVRGVGKPICKSGPSLDRKSTRLNSSHSGQSRMPSSA